MHAIRYNGSEVNVKYCKPLKNYCSSSEQIAKWPGNADPCSITLKNQILRIVSCAAQLLVQVLFISKLDYCKPLLADLPASTSKSLQIIKKAECLNKK